MLNREDEVGILVSAVWAFGWHWFVWFNYLGYVIETAPHTDDSWLRFIVELFVVLCADHLPFLGAVYLVVRHYRV